MATSLPPVPQEASPGERAFLEALRRMVLEQGKRIEELKKKVDESGAPPRAPQGA